MKSIITIAFLLVGQLVFGQNIIGKIDSLLNSAYSKKKINGNFLIAEKGKIIYNKSFGYTNEFTKEKLNENSVFELASVSKQFTAMAIMILKENGKLNLIDDITKFIPELSTYKGITIRNLLNHTGGLPDYQEIMDSLFDKSKIAVNKDIINLFAIHKPKLLFEPNTKWKYSNTGYALLGSIIEKVSGMDYGDYLNKVIFKPLKMNNTKVFRRRFTSKKINNYAFGYVYSDSLKKYFLPDDLSETKFVVYLDGIFGDGTVNSTVIDLLKWDRALYSKKLLSTEGMKEIFEVATLNDKSKTKYGFGWFVDENVDFGKVVSHSGGWPGYVIYIDRHITNDKTIIILQNHDNVSIPIKSINSILYNKPLPIDKIRKDQRYTQLSGQNDFQIFAKSNIQLFL